MPEYHRPIEIHAGGEKSVEGLTENGALQHLREAIILFICAEEQGFLFGGGVGGVNKQPRERCTLQIDDYE